MTQQKIIGTLVISFILYLNCGGQSKGSVKELKITILSTMLADRGLGEWGFCALVEADGRKILFDTGARPETVLINASELNIDLSGVEEVFISHNHSDHTGGLINLKESIPNRNQKTLSIAHVGEGVFYPRIFKGDTITSMTELKEKYQQLGGSFIIYDHPEEIYPGVWVTGPVPRLHNERNWSSVGALILPNGEVIEDTLPEDQSMVFNTDEGLIVLSGCGHSGIINTLDYAQIVAGVKTVTAAIGGFHLFNLSNDKIRWTSDKMKEFGVVEFIGAHCTGINAVYQVRNNMSLKREQVVVGAVGAKYELGKGINPGTIAR